MRKSLPTLKYLILTVCVLLSFTSLGLAQRLTQHLSQQKSEIIGIEALGDNQAAITHINEQQFVAIPTNSNNEVYAPYLEHKLPAYITADSMLRAFDILYQDSLLKLTEANHKKLKLLINLLIEKMTAGLTLLPPPATKSAIEKNLVIFQIAKALAGSKEDVGAISSIPGFEEELRLIEQGEGATRSPVLSIPIDYQVFRIPTEFANDKTRVQFFRTKKWLEVASYGIEDEADACGVMLLVLDFAYDDKLIKLWQELNDSFTYFNGPGIDLSIKELVPITQYIFGRTLVSPAEISEAQFATFRRLALHIEKPAKSFRLFGLRAGVENRLINALTSNRSVQFNGLDFVNIFISGQLIKTGDKVSEGEKERLNRIRRAQNELIQNEENTHFNRLIRCFRTLLNPASDGRYPAFTESSSWQDRLKTSVLAVWASSHSLPQPAFRSNLIEPRSFAYRESFHGYIEPNPVFFEALVEMAEGMREQTLAAHLYLPIWEEFIQINRKLGRMVEKQLAGVDFAEDEIDLIENYGERLAQLCYVLGGYLAIPPMGLKSVIMGSEKNRIACTAGPIHSLYVVVPFRGGHYLCLGATLAYSETVVE